MSRQLGSRYVLEEPLGRGATGTVWRGRVRETGEPVAVKVLREELATDPDVVTRFLRERSLLLNLRHPNLVAVRDLVVEGDVLALVMELIDGPDLRAHLRAEGTLDPAEAAKLLTGVLDALAATHARGIVHRDLKPANILLRDSGDGLQPLLTDFGIARLAEGPQITRTHELLGTPHYVAPETASGGIPTPAADVYAAGIVLYELVAGSPPFLDDNPFGVLRQHVEATPKRPAGAPDLLWQLISDCLRKNPAGRPAAPDLVRRMRRAAELLEGRNVTGTVVTGTVAGGGPAAGAEDQTKTLDTDRTQRLRDETRVSSQDNPPTLVDSAPTTQVVQPPQPAEPQRPRPAMARQPKPQEEWKPNWRMPPPGQQARQRPPQHPAAARPAAPQAPRPIPQQTPRQAPWQAPPQPPWQPPQQPTPKPPKQRRRRGIPGMGCLRRLVIMLVILVVLLGLAYYYLQDTWVGQVIDYLVDSGPDLLDRLLNEVSAQTG